MVPGVFTGEWLMAISIWPFRSSAPLVPVVRLTGVISPAQTPLRSALNLAQLAESLQGAFDMKGAKAVALAINSPGGSPVQSALIAGRVRALAREKDLPVFAFVEDVAASGGYWLACAADEIYADASSIVGSIGVISAGFGFVDAIKRLGVERRVHTRGARKMLLDPFQPERDDDVARLVALQTDIHQAFIAHVRDRRGQRLKGDDEALFNGDVWSGTQAKAIGLVDGLGDMRSVLRDRFGDKVRLRTVGRHKGWLRRRLGLAGGRAPEELAYALLDGLESRALWARYGL